LTDRDVLLAVRDLRIALAGGRPLVHGVSFTIEPRRTLVIVGESGAGKTLTCHALLGLLPTDALVTGSVRFAGQQILGLPERELRAIRGAGLALIFQDPGNALNPSLRIGAQIAEVARRHRRLDTGAARSEACALLGRLGFGAPERTLRTYPHQLSGGMQQRATIAMALAGRPRLLIADEPTRSLDAIAQSRTLRLIQDLQRDLEMALVLVTHDARVAEAFPGQTLTLSCGRQVDSCTRA
jgi:ABC-type glutathione transport system ATPase component